MAVDLDEAKERGSKLLMDIARACPNDVDPTPIGRVAFFLVPRPRVPSPEELYTMGLKPHAGVEANIESTFAAPTLADLEYARELLAQYLNSAESNAGGFHGAERQDELMGLPYYRLCLAYLDEVIVARDAN